MGLSFLLFCTLFFFVKIYIFGLGTTLMVLQYDTGNSIQLVERGKSQGQNEVHTSELFLKMDTSIFLFKHLV